MHDIPLELIDLQGDGYHIIVEVELFGQNFQMVVDTGASKTVLDKNTLLSSGIDEDKILSSDLLSTGLGTNNMESYTLCLDSLKIGEWVKTNYTVAVLDLSTINYAYEQIGLNPVIGVLGSDLLKDHQAVIDYNSMRLSLQFTSV